MAITGANRSAGPGVAPARRHDVNGRKRILLVDDDQNFVTWLRSELELAGYAVTTASDGEVAVQQVTEIRPDLILLDVDLPKMTGREVCRKLREARTVVPIVMLTRFNEPHHEAAGIDDGADDYVCKPFQVQVLLARIRARLRRPPIDLPPEARYLRIGTCVFDRESLRLFALNGIERRLPTTAAKMLRHFVRNQGLLLTRDQILDGVFGYEFAGGDRRVDKHVSRLRKALGDTADDSGLIRATHGEGYIFVGPAVPVPWP